MALLAKADSSIGDMAAAAARLCAVPCMRVRFPFSPPCARPVRVPLWPCITLGRRLRVLLYRQSTTDVILSKHLTRTRRPSPSRQASGASRLGRRKVEGPLGVALKLRPEAAHSPVPIRAELSLRRIGHTADVLLERLPAKDVAFSVCSRAAA